MNRKGPIAFSSWNQILFFCRYFFRNPSPEKSPLLINTILLTYDFNYFRLFRNNPCGYDNFYTYFDTSSHGIVKKQHSVALSTAEAEYVALGSCCAQIAA
jgi:hypothetical protein